MTQVTAEEWKLLFGNINAYVNTQALEAAVSFDLFTLLSHTDGLTKEQVSDNLSISSYATSVLLLSIPASVNTDSCRS